MDVAGAVGGAVAGPGWGAALALVAQEAQATGATPERALSTGKQCSQEAGPACQAPRASAAPAEGCGVGTRLRAGSVSVICYLSVISSRFA